LVKYINRGEAVAREMARMTRINKTSKLICEILPPYHPPTLMRGVQRVLNNITNYTGAVDTYAHVCICTYPAENLEVVRARASGTGAPS